MKKLWIVLSAVVMLSACQEKKYGAFTVSGKVQNAKSQQIILEEIPIGAEYPVAIDSATLKSDGSFELHGMGKEESLYRIGFASGPYVLLVNDRNDIKLNIDINNFRAYKIEGSPASESLHGFFESYSKHDSTIFATSKELDSLQQGNAGDSILTIVRTKRDTQLKEMNEMVKDFINNSQSPAARSYVLGMANRSMAPDELKALVISSADKFKEHSGLAKIKAMVTTQSTKPAATNNQYFLLDQPAPDINLPDVNGKAVALSSFRGKYVLVDFWASWCGPCRRENPNVVAAYNKFKDKNFTILGVSLDEDKTKWTDAIKADNLAWTQISDLKYWESSVVQQYKIEGIPFNVLVDPQGKIVASNLRGEDLEAKLAQVLK